MPTAPLPPNETQRLAALHALGILGTPPEERFDRLTRLAALTTNCPVALVSLVDAEEQFFKSRFGIDVCRTDRSSSFCAYTILNDNPLIIEDATTDPRVSDNPLVTGEPGIRAYAGVPLKAPDGSRIGSFCVIDYVPRRFDPDAVELLRILASIANDELSSVRITQLVAQLDEARRAADHASRAKGDFLAMMSHEIRTPLNGVIGFADLLARTELNAEQQNFIAGIQSSSELLLTLINDILDFSKIESGHLELESKAFALAPTLESVRTMFLANAKAKGIELTYQMDPNTPPFLRGDPIRFRQIWVNLVSNALKFTESGSVQMSVQSAPGAPAGTLLCEVTDTGCGIPPEAVSRLFKPFSQASASTARKHGGTGLGLAICKRLCELMNGSISLKSTPGLGSTFSFTVRLENIDGYPNLETTSLPSIPAHLPLTVLAAEDNPVNQRVLRQFLHKLGCHATIVGSGTELLATLQAAPTPDLILMDVQMPDMDGFEATRQIRLWEARHIPKRRTRIVALTANAMPEDRAACLAAGMDGFLPKPIRLDTLAAELIATRS
ncbi:MAG: hypothetical protein OHK005_06450 [Candidatus Methylacidiphilales bacterium]